MPLLPRLGFASTNLFVAYRADAYPQEVWIDVATENTCGESLSAMVMAALSDQINAGGAGSREYAPSLGCAEILSGPSYDSVGPNYSWVVRWAAVSPVFLRSAVERLCLVGHEEPAASMSIRGALPIDDSALSATTRDVLSWLDDPSGYPGRFPSVPFPVAERPGRGAGIRLTLTSPMTPEIHSKLEELIATWIEGVQLYTSASGHPVCETPDEYLFRSGVAKYEYRAILREFTHAARPSSDLLVNMCHRFHVTTTPLASAEIRL